MSQADTDRDPIDVLAEEFAARCRRGETPSVTEYARLHPDLAEEIQELFPAVTLLENLKEPPARPADEPLPEQLGDYRILREVGRGGMGIVYEAEQVSLGRRVALKVLPNRQRLGPDQLERFRREARAAGRLHHTNIVPVFGVGEHDGTHYYVMQFIAGQGLERVLARLRAVRDARPGDPTVARGDLPPAQDDPTFTVEEELAALASPPAESDLPEIPDFTDPNYPRFAAGLAAQAADALDHAHRQGIIHRDIKPANLLLDRAGGVWITDFGLAKFLEHDDLTRPGEVAGTLRYSAPERFAGKSDARADIYSLGLTLYELLTLRPACDEADPGKLLLQVTQARIARPRALNPGVPRDLETIVLRCLAPEPHRRYQSADELADDLRRFLDDRPIKARRTSTAEHAWRWCRRNPAVAGLSAALLLVFLVGFAGVVWKWREASANLALVKKSQEETEQARQTEAEQRRLAEEQGKRAEGNLDLAREAFERIARQLASGRPGVPLDSGDEAPAPPIVTQEAAAILQDLVRFHERFAATNSADPRLKRDTAQALRLVGTIRVRLGDYPQAIDALTRAADLLAGEPDQMLELAQTRNDLGVVLRAAGNTPEAIRAHGRALEILDAWPDPSDPRVNLELARTHNMVGALEVRQMRNSTAEQSQRKALSILGKLIESDEDNPEFRHLLARTNHDLSQTLWWTPSRRQEAADARSRAQKTQEKLAADFPRVPDYRAELAEMLLGPRLFAPRPPGDAEKRCARAVEIAADLSMKYPAVPDYQALLARAKTRLGQVQMYHPGKAKEATQNLRDAVKLYNALATRSPAAPAQRLSGLEAKYLLGELLRRTKKLDESSKVLNESVEELKKAAAASPRNRMARGALERHARSLAKTLQEQGKKEEADKLLKLAEEMAAKKP